MAAPPRGIQGNMLYRTGYDYNSYFLLLLFLLLFLLLLFLLLLLLPYVVVIQIMSHPGFLNPQSGLAIISPFQSDLPSELLGPALPLLTSAAGRTIGDHLGSTGDYRPL